MPPISAFFARPSLVFTSAIILRLVLLVYGRWQDANSPVKYTDIDYLVFTDAARFIAQGRSPYDRATYRYTPLLAWLLYPTSLGGRWFEFGKVLFALGDVVTGWFIMRILKKRGMPTERAMKFASIWLLNPMVANISTRGSSEGLLAVIVVAILWAATEGRYSLAGGLLGFAVHVKIYPFIYAASLWWAYSGSSLGTPGTRRLYNNFGILLNYQRAKIAVWSLLIFLLSSSVMFNMYGMAFVKHTFTYHLTRIDHRHNFSAYNTLLHLDAAQSDNTGLKTESLAFIPQLFLSVFALPILLARKDLASTMLAQTFAFVTFNKVCTSQYFLWYMVFLPFYLPSSSMLKKPRTGITALLSWILGQALWLQQAYELEFLGNSTFLPGLWLASLIFFAINCWILGIIVRDIQSGSTTDSPSTHSTPQKTR